ATADEDVLPAGDAVMQKLRGLARNRSALDQVVHGEVPRVEFPDREGDAVHATGRQDGGDAAAVRQARVEDRLFFRDFVAQATGDDLEPGQQLPLVDDDPRCLLQKPVALDEHAPAAVDHDFADAVVFDKVAYRLQEGQDQAEPVELCCLRHGAHLWYSDFVRAQLRPVGFLAIQVPGLEVAVGGLPLVHAVEGNDDALGIPEQCEAALIEDEVLLGAVGLGRADGALVRYGLAGEQANAGVGGRLR